MKATYNSRIRYKEVNAMSKKKKKKSRKQHTTKIEKLVLLTALAQLINEILDIVKTLID